MGPIKNYHLSSHQYLLATGQRKLCEQSLLPHIIKIGVRNFLCSSRSRLFDANERHGY